MIKKRIKNLQIYLLLTAYWMVTLVAIIPSSVAVASSCSAVVTPKVVPTNKAQELAFTVTNTGSDTVEFVRFESPSSQFQITTGRSSGWARTVDSSEMITFKGGALSAGDSHEFRVTVQTGVTNQPPSSWAVYLAANLDGNNRYVCSGDTEVAINDDTSAPIISDIEISNVTHSQAEIRWNTDKASKAVIYYGTSNSYGSVKSSEEYKESHNMALTDLQPNTVYYYKIEVTDEIGNVGQSTGANFTTAENDTSGPAITNIQVKDVGVSQATITWSTDRLSTSAVFYGQSKWYGFNKNNTTLTKSHSITLTALSSDTSYHYKIKAVDSAGNVTETNNNIFLTASFSSDTEVTEDTTGESSSENIIIATPPPRSTVPESSAPRQSETPEVSERDESLTISLLTDFTQAYEETPMIHGEVSGISRINAIEYSTDGGQNWLPVDEIKVREGDDTVTDFNFFPQGLTDGNYDIVVRTVGINNSAGITDIHKLILSRLTPQVGMSVYTHGAQALKPSDNGYISTVTGLDQRITLAAVGGAVSIDIIARQVGGNNEQVFSLVRNIENGLWTGVVNFAEEGVYELTVKAVDGAGNKSERSMHPLVVQPSGQVTGGGDTIEDATVTAFVWEPVSQKFVVWDGHMFGQANPQQTSSDGSYHLLLPPGKYYLEVTAPDWRTLESHIFTIDEHTPVSTELELSPSSIWHPWPKSLKISFHEKSVSESDVEASASPYEDLIGQQFPFIDLQKHAEFSHASRFLGKPAVVSFLADWLPQTSEQVAILDALSLNDNYYAVGVLAQNTVLETSIFSRAGRYKLSLFADPAGDLIESLGIHSAPTHVFVDKGGFIKGIQTGIFSEEELLDKL